MAYSFSTQIIGSTKTKLVGESKEHTINGVNSRLSNADSLMAGLSSMYDIVGWQIQNVDTPVVRTNKEDVIDNG